jgi:ABC-type transport system substrate-binding protein
MEFEFLCPSGLAVLDTLLAYLQDTWKAVGISISPVALEFPALTEATTTNPTFEMMLAGFNWDSTFFQDVMFACDMHQAGFNFMKYCNPELDVIGEQIHVTLDLAERVPLMIEYSNIVNDEQPVGIIWFGVSNAAFATRIHNSFPGPWGGPGIEYLWLEE